MTRQMTAKSFLFVAAWMQPLKALPLQQRWNVIEAIMEYSISGEVTMPLDPMETLAFGFIRNEIDRMKSYRAERRETRRAATNRRWEKEPKPIELTEKESTDYANDANACKAEQADAPYYILSESESKSESESESEKKSSSTSCVRARVRGVAGKDASYDDSHLHPRFIDNYNPAKLSLIPHRRQVPNPRRKNILGHNNLATAERYMGSFDTSKTDETLRNVFNKKPSKQNKVEEPTATKEEQAIELLNGMTPAQIMTIISAINN